MSALTAQVQGQRPSRRTTRRDALPAMFWFYPREFAGQTSTIGSAHLQQEPVPNFNARSMQFLARLGYAVVERMRQSSARPPETTIRERFTQTSLR